MTLAAERLAEFSRLVGSIYDAAVEPDRWPEALEAICGFIDAKTAVLQSYDVFDRSPPFQRHVGYEPQWLEVYFAKYYALNPYMDDVARLGPGDCAFTSSRPDYQDLFQSEFYTGWLKPQALVDGSVLVVEKSMSNITTLVNARGESEGPFDETTLERLNLIYPHLRRAMLIGRAFESHRRQRADDAAVLDSLAAGMFLLGRRGDILQANAAGAAMLAARSALKNNGGRLELAVPSADRLLKAALAAGREGEAVLGGKGASIPVRGEDSESSEYIVHLLPLNAVRQQSIDASQGADFVVFVRRIDGGDIAAIAAFTQRFNLTPKEAHVLQTVVEVGGVPQAADVLGLSAATVRTHVTAIFDKSGVRRQADLIRLLMEMTSPFAR
ncbi:helix-turn-helix transcriptional regulator [Phenylobacterium sp.]|uniref:helix-turn-helix transcriptional regulator n=1 Tax=Phenylobacterium sp. TaxID=1871053 RepID=UPI00374D0978